MKFRYKNYGQGILRPVIPIEIIFNNKSVSYEVLVDSGADSNIFSSEIADILGINVTKGDKAEVAGITGESKPFYFHNSNIKVGGNLHKDIRIGFLEDIGKYAYGVVGQKGFFDIFVVKFDLIKKEIELKPRGLKINGVVPAFFKNYSDKEIREIAIESRIEKYKNDFEKIPSIISNEPQ